MNSTIALDKTSNKSLSNSHWIGTYSFLLPFAGLHSFAMSSFDERHQAKRFLIASTVLQRRSVNLLGQLTGKDHSSMDSKKVIILQHKIRDGGESKRKQKRMYFLDDNTFRWRVNKFLSKFNHELAAFMSIELIRNLRNLLFVSESPSFLLLREKQICPVSARIPAACLCLMSDILYLTSPASILFGFDQLASGLAHVVAGLIHAVLNAVHHLTLSYRT